MASKREQVLDAVLAVAVAALPDARVGRNIGKPETIPADGFVNIRDGDPGEPDVTIGVLAYSYQHQVALEFAHPTQAGLDNMLAAFGDAIEADRFLSGLAEWMEPQAPSTGDIEALGAETERWADLSLTVAYTTSNPLT